MSLPSLTIGIPTFNRRTAVLELVDSFLASGARHSVQLLVIDDGSVDGTEAALRKRLKGEARAKIVTHDRNLGYARTYKDLFDHCASDYLVVSADDDELMDGQLDALSEALGRHQPDFVASQWFATTGRMVRGTDEERRIAPSELLRASHHAPGLVYRVAACRDGLQKLEQLIERGSGCALVWPQVIVAASLLATGDCWWWPEPVVREGAALPSGIGSVATVCAGWETVKSLDEHFESEVMAGVTPAERAAFEEMRRVNANRVYATLRGGVLRERPFLLQHFDRVARRHVPRLYVKAVLDTVRAVRLSRSGGEGAL